MKTYRVDHEAMYLMQLPKRPWYRIPPAMVNNYLRAGADIKVSKHGSAWVLITWPDWSTSEHAL
jgi:hypothetical protein